MYFYCWFLFAFLSYTFLYHLCRHLRWHFQSTYHYKLSWEWVLKSLVFKLLSSNVISLYMYWNVWPGIPNDPPSSCAAQYTQHIAAHCAWVWGYWYSEHCWWHFLHLQHNGRSMKEYRKVTQPVNRHLHTVRLVNYQHFFSDSKMET